MSEGLSPVGLRAVDKGRLIGKRALKTEGL